MDRPLVLVVDDDGRISAFVREALEEEGYRVAIAGSGDAALAQARALLPALILLDMHIPGIGSEEVASLLRADPGTATIPIVALSGGSRARYAALPLDGWLAKPFMLDDLYAAVARWCGVGRRPLSYNTA